jgi:ornithine cyclodeaminase
MIYLSGDDVDAAGANMPLAVDVVENVLSLHARGEVNLPSKVVLDMDERRHGRINAMPAHVGGDVKMCGIKWVAGFPSNPVRYGLPRANALVILNDPETGLPMAIIEGTRINALRTGAVTGVGVRYLARHDSRILGLIGAGVQARTQIDAVRLILPGIDEIRFFDVRREAAIGLEAWCRKNCPDVAVTVAQSPEPVVAGADIVITATVADEPIVKAAWLKEGVLFVHVGSYQEEEEAVVLQADKVIVDIWEEVLHRRTPLLARMCEAGTIDGSRIHADIAEVINGDKPGRENDTERIFFSPLGLGSEDIALGAEIYRRAVKLKLGLPLGFGRGSADH